MAIDRNVIVSIPENAYVEKDQTVFVKDVNIYDPVKKYYRVKHTIIGRQISEGKMYPNTNYAKRYPLLYEQASGQKLRRRTMNIGFYVTVLAITSKLRLYEILENSFGIVNANMILDYCMYSIVYRSCVVDQYSSSMKDQMFFSNSLWQPSRISAFFEQEFSESRISEFTRLWTQNCMDRGMTDVWIVIGGTINGLDNKTEFGEQAVISDMYIVDVTTGNPIAIFVYRDSRVDGKAVLEIIGWLQAFNMQTKGVIVDQSFVSEDLFRELDKNGIIYVAMLKDNSLAHTDMLALCAEKICMKYEYMLGKYRPDSEGSKENIYNDSPVLYGTSSTEKINLFDGHTYKSYAYLYFDGQERGERLDEWNQKVTETAYSLQSDLNSGKQAEIPEEFKDYIIETKIKGRPTILVDENKVQSAIDKKGYFTLVSSSKMDVMEVNRVYSLRNYSEEVYSMVKKQIGSDDGSNSIVAKLIVAFITSIICKEILNTAQKNNIPKDEIINELDNLKMYLDDQDKYYVSHTYNQRAIDFLHSLGVAPETFDELAATWNDMNFMQEHNPHHKLPELKSNESKKAGRPKGAKNILPKKVVSEVEAPKRPGRPKGVKNQRTLEKEKHAVKKGPGNLKELEITPNRK